jgi:ABC-type bacteriocin/lantibiotic exporter with double-glycine peptidase domain
MNTVFTVLIFSLSTLTQECSVSPTEVHWREPINCGPNALYAFMRLHDANVTYADVREAVGSTDGGSSFLQLKTAARKLGRSTEVFTCDFESLRDLSLPAIVHLSGVRGGHFLILLRVNEDSVIVGDGIDCEIQELSNSAFAKSWSGFVLASRRIPLYKAFTLFEFLCIFIAVAISCSILIFSYLRRTRTTPGRGLTSIIRENRSIG